MSMKQAAARSVARMRTVIVGEFLPDYCRITLPNGTPVVSSTGGVTRATAYLQYKNSDWIPCRMDASRAFRAEVFPHEEMVASEFVLHIPADAPKLKAGYTLEISGDERNYEVRKLAEGSNWDVTQEVLITRLDKDNV